ncbi:nose resistant to fluoxetine protein 6-like [Sitophilus oryzae]|uniref:Nose resistant to fluoxetine protein 6-like n=1 Tax=Sitophilus oryzae TaxID=7048 RepID=A0A6J2X8S3_SITOR|nr:nose resistant to fluoxetine protein 6-like [Sitophilus oryzae]
MSIRLTVSAAFLCQILVAQFVRAHEFEDYFRIGQNLNLSEASTLLKLNDANFNIENMYLDVLCGIRSGKQGISESCAKQMDIVCSNQDILNPMADAWSKFPYTGLLVTTPQDYGTYDQCVQIDRYVNDTRILGKHCTYGWVIPLDQTYILSYCVPEACSASDIVNMVTNSTILVPILEQLVNERSCQTKESNTSMNASEIVVTCFFCLFLASLVLSTSYDIIASKRNRKPHPLYTAFSVVKNGKKLLKVTTQSASRDQILAFHGLRAISMLWILAGHSVGMFTVVPLINVADINEFQRTISAFYIMGGYFAVDTFFYLSGFLIAYQYFKAMGEKSMVQQAVSIPQMIIHRYLRITPALLMLFLYGVYISKFVGSGPMAYLVNQSVERPCKEHWWSVFLYIQNYYNFTDLCYTHLWYLSTDWQLFLLAPLILIPTALQYRRRFNWVLGSLLGLNLIFVFIPLWTKLQFREYDPTFREYDTQSKLTDYFLGFTLGFYMRTQKHRRYLFNSSANLVLWAVSLAGLLGTVIIYQAYCLDTDQTYVIRSLAYTFTKPAWCIFLSFVIYACANGKGGFINSWLSSSFMQILSKLSYCMYLMHVPVILFWLINKRTKEHFSHYNLFFLWCGHTVITVFLSIIWTLSFESPLITIEGLIFRKPRRPSIKKENGNTT